jgi:Mg2+ and Co2+ transporter CorA
VTTPTAIDQRATTRVYRAGQVEKDNFPVTDISEYIDQPDTTVWVDLLSPDTDDLQVVAEELGLHELAIADAVNARQRPKLDRYATHDFLNMYAVRLDTETGQLRLSELAAFITPTRSSPSTRTTSSTSPMCSIVGAGRRTLHITASGSSCTG